MPLLENFGQELSAEDLDAILRFAADALNRADAAEGGQVRVSPTSFHVVQTPAACPQGVARLVKLACRSTKGRRRARHDMCAEIGAEIYRLRPNEHVILWMTVGARIADYDSRRDTVTEVANAD